VPTLIISLIKEENKPLWFEFILFATFRPLKRPFLSKTIHKNKKGRSTYHKERNTI
jgi:hypothetical protein